MDARTEIKGALEKALSDLGVKRVNVFLERPKDDSHGDYSSSIALVAFEKNKESGVMNQEWKTPLDFAERIVESIIQNSKFMIHFDRVEAVAPGFINFWLSRKYLIGQLSLISDKTPLRPFGSAQGFAGRRIMVEFTDPNPFKEFHIGHLYSNTVGESVSRLLESLGAIVKRANYQGDVGMHVAKALYGLLPNSKFIHSASSIQNSKLEEKSLKERIKILGEAYAFGAKAYEEDEKAKREIEELNKKIYAKDEAVMPLYEKGRQWSLEYFETIYKRLGTKFDFYYFESEVGNEGLKLVKKHLRAGVFEESQGAVIFPGEKQGLHNRVFINSLGLPTYEAKELGLALKKYEDFKFDQSIVVTGNEIIGYFKVLLAALSKINPDLAAKTNHLPHGMVKLPTGKMSSRTGNILTGEWLLDEAKKLLKSKYPEMEKEVLEKVAVGSVKYALLKSSIGHDIEFDFKESINIQGNSGPYLQYTFARTQSVLTKSEIRNLKSEINSKSQNLNIKKVSSFDHSNFDIVSNFDIRASNLSLRDEETVLLRTIHRFPEVVEQAGGKFAPNILCTYLFDLAQKFNLFYQKHRIIGDESAGVNGKHPRGVIETQEFRVALTTAVGQVIKNGLYLLGIEAPEKM